MAANVKSKNQSKQVKNKETSVNQMKDEKPAKKKGPTEEQIRRKAQEIYYQRLHKGESGSELDDWQKAEKLLTES